MLSFLLLSGVALAQEAPPRVLHLGNSYTFYNDLQLRVAESLRSTVPAMADAEGARLAAGGLRLPDHVERVETGNPQWVDALTGEPGRWTWMVLQDQSQIPGFPESEGVWQQSADAVPVLDGYAVDQGAETVLFMTWGRRDGDSSNPEMYPDFEAMNARLDAGYRAYATRGSTDDRTLWIAPVGRAFGAVYSRVAAAGGTPEDPGTDFYRLYDGDGSHPSPYGTALSAAVLVRTLTGWSPDWDTAPPGVDAAELDWLVAAADAAVVPFDDLPYPWAVELADYTPATDVDPGLGLVVSGEQLCMTVGIGETVDPADTVTVGAEHDGLAGCGRVWVRDGGSWTVDTLAADGGATGSVVVIGGDLNVDVLGVPAALSGGALTVAASAAGALTVSGGSLAMGAGTTGITLDMTGGSLVVDVADGPAFSEDVTLAGTLEAGGTPSETLRLLSAGRITLAHDLVHTLGEDWALEVRTVDGVEQLWAVAAEETGDDGGGDDGGAVGEGTAGGSTSGGDDSSEGDDVATDDTPSGTSGDTDKSGCAVTAGASGGLVLALVAVARRRRD